MTKRVTGTTAVAMRAAALCLLVLQTGCFSPSGDSGGGDGDSGVDEGSKIPPAPPFGGVDASVDEKPTAGVTIEAMNFPGSEPDYVVSSSAASVQVWLNSFGELGQSLFKATDGSVRTRVIFDDSSGDPAMIIDETTGSYVAIVESVGRLDFLGYDLDNDYVGGFAIVGDGAGFELGEVVGAPAFQGQIQGQLISNSIDPSSGVAQTGSFAVIADNFSGLDNVDDITSDMETLLAAQSGQSEVDGFQGIGVSASALISISKALKWGGVVLGGAALVGIAAPAMGAAGAAMVLGGFFANDVANFIESKFSSDDPYSQEMVDLAVEALRDPSTTSLGGLMQRAKDAADNLFGGSNDVDADFDFVDSYSDPTDDELEDFDLPVPGGGPPSMSVSVAGQAVWQDQTSYLVTGNVDGDGNVTITGSDPNDSSKTISVTGSIDEFDTSKVTGTYERGGALLGGLPGLDTGSADATITEVAECMTTTASGGQGTFTNAHSVGIGPGNVDFTYDAYGIEDAFDVSVDGATVFSTGGLVANGTTVSIPVSSSGIIFVSVSAPQSGTAWDYSLTCL